MDKEELAVALDELVAARDSIDRAITAIKDILHTPTAKELRLQLAALEGWSEMDKYIRGRKQ